MYTVSVPISVPVSKKKRFYLNLNQYRNAHHHTLARAKVNFHEIVAPTLKHLPHFKTVNLVYTLFTGTEQLCDTANICSIVDKFFSDVMVSCKRITDDNRKIVLSVSFRWGGVDKFAPRVEVSITPGENSPGSPATEHNPEERKMQITIPQLEIEQAIEKHVREQVVVRDDQEVLIDLKATRGPEGYQAVINIQKKGEGAPARSTTAKKGTSSTKAASGRKAATAGTKAASTKEVAEEPAPVEPVVAQTETVEEAPVEVKLEPAVAEVEEESTPAATEEAAVETETAEASEEGAPAPAARPSLFANLKPPVNA
jgi:uncharacterized protein (DUF4415 family)